MSISMFLVDARDENQKSYNLPVATEDVFKRIWLPEAKELNANLVLMFEFGVEIKESEVPKLIDELSQLNSRFKRYLKNDDIARVILRIERLVEEISRINREFPGSVLYIG